MAEEEEAKRARETALVAPLSAVRVLYSTERRAAEYDILVATAVECLHHGGSDFDGLLARVRGVWASVGISDAAFRAAITAAEAADLVYERGGRFALTDAGRSEVDKSHGWAEDLMTATASQLRAKADEQFRPLSDDEAHLWVGILAFALMNGIAKAAAAYRGDVRLGDASLVSPTAIDEVVVRREIGRASRRDDVTEFLEAMALSAIDPADPFGNELVSSITTGYLLQAFLARRDAIQARTAVGPIRGQVVILDTPILLQLLPESTDAPLHAAIRAARDSGVTVQVGNHTVDELFQVLRRIERDHATTLVGTIGSARRLQLLRRLTDAPLIEVFASGAAAGRWTTWSAFRDFVLALPARLEAVGVQIEKFEPREDDRTEDLNHKLEEVVATRSHGRGLEELRRDAITMTLASRLRLTGARPGTWPAAWIITTDTAIAIAYRRVFHDPDQVTIAPSQWVSVLAAFAEVQTIEELARSAATMVAQETMLRVAAKYPLPAVLQIAEALQDASESEIRYAQLVGDDIIRDLPDHGVDPTRLGLVAAAKMLDLRARRLEMAQRLSDERHEAERARLHEAAFVASGQAEEARLGRDAKEEELRRALSQTATGDDARRDARILSSRRERRAVALAALVVLGISALLGLGLTSEWHATLVSVAAASLISAVLFGYSTITWIRDPTVGIGNAIWWIAVELISLLGFAKDLRFW